jgi:hypothetical protein
MNSTDKHHGRQPAFYQIAQGYLTETLAAATVVFGKCRPATAKMRLFAFDDSGDFGDTGAGRNIIVTNLDEGDTYAAGTRIAAWRLPPDPRWFPFDLSCSPSTVAIEADP